ncbi:TolB family protein [Anaerosalibacter massiliensis]|uniref:Translocation protein TolB n=1 Tax=Anaerosalibacter massiliensis TaxID=1347392 RepID=A0A9X2S535_9FIRM|nr:hypothetical protein [Anaerosalibacter massiliensis]MCR2043919.1 hypothetical protein [Anaerosalibacter massiliensis]
MRKIILPIFIIFLSLALTSCNTIQNSKIEPADNDTKEKPIKYKVEKIVLSKGYQSLEPNVEILKKNKNIKILVSLGLVESSGIKIDGITKNNNEINIYTNRLVEDNKTQLAIPQAIVNLKISSKDNIDDIKFNIINQNYEPIELKFGKSQILSKIYSQYKIAPNTVPLVDLVKTNESFIWNIDFNSIFNKDDLESPLVNLHVKADANTGEILLSNREIISEYIDDGLILDYIPQHYILYKQEQIDDGKNTNMLWLYNLKNGEKEKIYETKHSIYSASFSPDNKHIAFIENDEDISDIYLININEKTANKITPIDYNHTWNIKWINEDNLYFVNNNEKNSSTLLKYNIVDKNSQEVFSVGKTISDFDFKDNLIVFTEYSDKDINQNIYITKDGSNLIELDKGYRISFIDKNSIIYLKNSQDKNIDLMCIYDIENNSKNVETELDVKNYIKLDQDNLLVITKNSCNNDYTLNKYNIIDNSSESIAEITGETFFYDEVLNRGYVSLSAPMEKDERHIIYSIDLNKISLNKK